MVHKFWIGDRRADSLKKIGQKLNRKPRAGVQLRLAGKVRECAIDQKLNSIPNVLNSSVSSMDGHTFWINSRDN